MSVNKKPIKISEVGYNFFEGIGNNRVKLGTDKKTMPISHVPDALFKYFKLNNERYIEFCKMEVENGNN